MSDNKCEICNEPAACWYYCSEHHKSICVEDNSSKEVREKLGQETVSNTIMDDGKKITASRNSKTISH